MKKFLMLMAAFSVVGSVFAAPPPVAPNCSQACDVHWKACISSCIQGPTGQTCESSCASQHEDCLNGCSKNSLINPSHQFSNAPSKKPN